MFVTRVPLRQNRSPVPADVARRTFALAGELLLGFPLDADVDDDDDSGCVVRRAPWAAYHAALSVHGPADLHPRAMHLAALFLRGDDADKAVVALAVLAWRAEGLAPPPVDAPEFAVLRDLPGILEKLPLTAPVDPLLVCALLCPHLPHTAPFCLEKLRDRAFLESWRLEPPPLLGPPPPRLAARAQPGALPGINPARAVMLARAFQAMEGSDADSPFEFTRDSFYIQDIHTDVWFVVA